MTWDASSTLTVTRDAAIAQIKAKAAAKGYTGGFKVVYDGVEIETPAQLPEQVDMSKVEVANKLNNALSN
jgi:hypothetical protein